MSTVFQDLETMIFVSKECRTEGESHLAIVLLPICGEMTVPWWHPAGEGAGDESPGPTGGWRVKLGGQLRCA